MNHKRPIEGEAAFRRAERTLRAEPGSNHIAQIKYAQRYGQDITDLFTPAIHFATTLPPEQSRSYIEKLFSVIIRNENLNYGCCIGLALQVSKLKDGSDDLPFVLEGISAVQKYLPGLISSRSTSMDIRNVPRQHMLRIFTVPHERPLKYLHIPSPDDTITRVRFSVDHALVSPGLFERVGPEAEARHTHTYQHFIIPYTNTPDN
jgi:hypothetical protein